MKTRFSEIIAQARAAFNHGVTKSIDFRLKQVENLYKLCDENENALVDALYEDLKKPKQEAVLLEVEFVRNDIRCVQYNLRKWAEPESAEKNMILMFDEVFIVSEPYGVALILGAWNYPIQLTLSPLLGAIAAGNCAILKPSELAPHTSKLLAALLPKYLHPDCYHVITGGVEDSTELLKEQFDYIFFTGSSAIGKKVHEAANKYLTPVTLEMGGKCPVYVDDSVNLAIACRRMLWGKLINAGQTCVAPDYILCRPDVQDELIKNIKKTLDNFYGENHEESPDLGRIVNDKHFQRLSKLIKCGKVAIGGQMSENDRYISPTVLIDVKMDDSVMKEEIFGPILPIINVSGADEAVDIIKNLEKPLSLYVFSKNNSVIQKFLKDTSSGSVCINDSVVQLSVDALPFGGVGLSGMGRYHGKYSFDTFSHKKAVLVRNFRAIGEKLGEARYPPYSDNRIGYLQRLLKKRRNMIPPCTSYVVVFCIGIAFAIVVRVIVHFAGGDKNFPDAL